MMDFFGLLDSIKVFQVIIYISQSQPLLRDYFHSMPMMSIFHHLESMNLCVVETHFIIHFQHLVFISFTSLISFHLLKNSIHQSSQLKVTDHQKLMFHFGILDRLLSTHVLISLWYFLALSQDTSRKIKCFFHRKFFFILSKLLCKVSSFIHSSLSKLFPFILQTISKSVNCYFFRYYLLASLSKIKSKVTSETLAFLLI